MTPHKALRLRIVIGERHHHHSVPVYEAIVLKAREQRLAGATVFKSPMGFGYSSLLHTANILRLSEDLPMAVEIVDSEEKIRPFLEEIRPMLGQEGLVTLEEVTVV